MRQGNACNVQECPGISRVPNVAIGARSNELVFRIHGEVKREKLTKFMKAAEANT